jgi:phosphatidylinositol dimannoside acyltransferase
MTRRADRVATLTMRGAEWMGMHLPRDVGLAGARAFMRLELRRSPAQRAIVAGNLSRVLGHPADSEIVALATSEAFDLYARYWYETFALRSMPAEEVNRRHTVTGVEHIDAAIGAGRGVVMGLPHMGNWDAAGHWLAINGYRMTAVAEELKPKAVFDLFYRHRRALGMDIVPLSEGKRVGERLVMVLSENRILTLLADRNLSGRGVDVEMFGEARKLPSGPAMLSLMTGAPLLPSTVYTTAEGWHTHIDPPVEIERTDNLRADIATVTRILAACFERYISAKPADWHMFQPAWESQSATAVGVP